MEREEIVGSFDKLDLGDIQREAIVDAVKTEYRKVIAILGGCEHYEPNMDLMKLIETRKSKNESYRIGFDKVKNWLGEGLLINRGGKIDYIKEKFDIRDDVLAKT